MKIKIAILFMMIFFASSSFAKNKDSKFNSVDMVKFSSGTYIIGEGVESYCSERFVDDFEINRYETTYDLWYEVMIWGLLNGYNFQNPGQEGARGLRGKDPTKMNCLEPVTCVSWYDVIVWCNAFSEKSGLTPCYKYEGKVLKDSSDGASCDLAVCDFNANGYRLPSEVEWEYAARKTSSGMQRADLVSGQVDAHGNDDDSIPESELAWIYPYVETTRKVGTAGTPFVPSAPPAAGSGNPNGAGLFDMSGNILEWCWDWYAIYKDEAKNTLFTGPEIGSERILRGGSWNKYSMFASCADRYSFVPSEYYNYFGFRICRSLR